MKYDCDREQTVLITGGSGFIGSAIVERAREIGYRVSALSRREGHSADDRVVDLTDQVGVSRLVHELGAIDVLIHCAAIAHSEPPP